MLNIYRGRETVDKEKFIYAKIRELGGRHLVLVPNQYTLVAEKQALDRLNTKVLLDIEILSMARLGRNLLSRQGMDPESIINIYGRHMLISKILREENEELGAFRGMYGKESFVAAVNNFISKAKQYEVTPEMFKVLEEDSNSATCYGGSPLSRKIKDLTRIYAKYEEAIKGKYTDAEDLLAIYVEAAEKSDYLRDKHIWIYGFDSFTPRNISFIGALIKASLSVNVFLTWDTNCLDEDLFKLSEMVTEKLKGVARDSGSECSVIDLSEKDKNDFKVVPRARGIEILERELYSVSPNIQDGNDEGACEGITITGCATNYTEAEAAAAHVRYLLREKKYRLSDIVLICNDQNQKAGLISRVFNEYDVGIFDDRKRKVINTPLAVYVTAMATVLIYGFRAEDVIRILKTGLTEMTNEEIEELSEYARRINIRGALWKKAFTRGTYMRKYSQEGCLERLDLLRQKAMKPILAFEKIAKASKTYEEFINRFRNLIADEAGVPQAVMELAEKQREMNAMDVAEETEQIWDLMMQVFDQIAEIMGDAPFDIKEFNNLLVAGLSQLEVGVLPPSADDLLLGTMQRTRTGDVKAMLVLGANDGFLPLAPSEDPLFSKEEMETMGAAGLSFGSEDEIKRMEEDLAIYRGLYKPTDDLWISYVTSNEKGEKIQASEVVDTIKKIFPGLKERNEPNPAGDIADKLGGKTNTLRRYTEAARRGRQGMEIDPAWGFVAKWLRGRNHEESFYQIEDNLDFENVQEDLGKDLANELYRTTFSPTGLESFSRCPFAYFVSSGLREEEPRIDQVAGREIGEMYHEILQQFARKLTDCGLWDSIERGEAEKDIEKMARDWAEQYHDSLFDKSKREEYLLERGIRACKLVAWALVQQARAGEIKESRYEVFFGKRAESGDGKENLKPLTRKLNDGRVVSIEGRIDRMDYLNDDRVKIIDYKTGNDTFVKEEYASGYRLQLMLYLEAARGEEKKPAGVFYFKIKEPSPMDGMIKDLESEEAKTLDRDLMDSYRMDGAIIDNDEVIKEIAGEFVGSSSVVKLTRKKEGDWDAHSVKRLMSEDEMDSLQNRVKDITKNLCEEILAGRIEIKSKKVGNTDPCIYCRYHSICNFDRGFKGCSYEYV